MLTETQKFVSCLVYSQVRPPRLWWSRDLRKVSIDGETLELDAFRLGIREMIQAAWGLYNSISGGKRFADDLPENFKDDLSNDTYGYSFLSHGPFSTTPNGMLCHLVHERKLASIDSAGGISWDVPALRRFFGVCDQLNDLLAVLTFILPTISTRVTEFVDHKLRNASRNRGLHMSVQDMFLLSRYHKMTNLTGLDICTPTYYPEPLKELTLEIFAGGLRECEAAFAPILFEAKATELYHTSVSPVSSLGTLRVTRTDNELPPSLLSCFHPTATCGFEMGDESHRTVSVKRSR